MEIDFSLFLYVFLGVCWFFAVFFMLMHIAFKISDISETLSEIKTLLKTRE